jgi:ACS family hexuronate transporter-like MFS transporter
MISASPSRVRWWILSLLFFATTINYLDRIVFSFLAPVIRDDLHLDDNTYGQLNAAFQIAYTAGYVVAGRFVDRIGTRLGYFLATAWWSVAAMMHAFSGSAMQLGMWRFFLGLGEAGNFPSAIKAVSEWFPKKERAFATGIFNAGTNVAAMIGPPVFAFMLYRFGWRTCFLVTGSAGFVWIAAWWLLYRLPDQHKSVNKEELAHIHSDTADEPEVAKVGWGQAIRIKQTWGFALAKFFTDPVWWFYLYWLPLYLKDVRKLEMSQVGWILPFIYFMADIGSVAGGWLSGFLIRRGWAPGRARKTTMLLCALCMPIAALGVLTPDLLTTVLLFSLATAAHQGWSANLFTTTSDVFPKAAVGSVVGIGGSIGGIGGTLFSALIPGYVIGVLHIGYTPLFLGMSCFYLIALGILHLLMGRLEPLRTSE